LGEWISSGETKDMSAQAQLARKGIIVSDQTKPRIFSRTFEELVREKEAAGQGLIQTFKTAFLG
jgi:hypothetical protein